MPSNPFFGFSKDPQNCLLTFVARQRAVRDRHDLPLVVPLGRVAPDPRGLDRVIPQPRQQPRELAVAVEGVSGEVAGKNGCF